MQWTNRGKAKSIRHYRGLLPQTLWDFYQGRVFCQKDPAQKLRLLSRNQRNLNLNQKTKRLRKEAGYTTAALVSYSSASPWLKNETDWPDDGF